MCPWNSPKIVELTTGRDYRPDWRDAVDRPDVPEGLPGTELPSLVDLMRMTREEWDEWTRGSAIRRAGYTGFRRNVAVALGNWLASAEGEPPAVAVAVLLDAPGVRWCGSTPRGRWRFLAEAQCQPRGRPAAA